MRPGASSGSLTGAAPSRHRDRLRRIPLFHSLEGYDRSALSSDVAAGATVGVMLVPQGMAYAMIAGLPPVYGLYAALVPLAVYALLGTSRQLAVGPVAMVALLVANGVGPLAEGDPERWVTLAVLLSVLVGVIQLAMGVFRAGFLVNLLSHPVLAGFTSAAAIIIGMSQLGGLTGLSVPKGLVHEMAFAAGRQWGSVHGLTLLVGTVAIGAGILLRRTAPRLPGPMVVVVAGTLASWLLGLGGRGVDVVGVVPAGLPLPRLPGSTVGDGSWLVGTLADARSLLPVAIAISLVGFMESIAVAKVYASRNRYDIDADQELRALGAANLAGAFFQSFPVTGGFSRTAVNGQAGARSQIASLVSVVVVGVTLLFLTPLFYPLPKAILAAIIVVAVAGLVDVKTARTLWRIDRQDFALMAATFLATLFLGIEEGIVVGAALSIMVVLYRITRPSISVLGREPVTGRFRSIDHHPDAKIEPGIAVLRMDASLFYGNAEAFRDAAREALAGARARMPPETERAVLVVDGYPINRTDSTGLHMLHELVYEIRAVGGRVYLAGVKRSLAEALEAGGLTNVVGPEHFFPDLPPAVDAAHAWLRDADDPTPASDLDIAARVARPEAL